MHIKQKYLAAAGVAALAVSLPALADTDIAPQPHILRAEIVARTNVRDLLAKAAQHPELAAVPRGPIEMKRHKYPFQAGAARTATPFAPAPNVRIASYKPIAGKLVEFNGTYEGSNAPAIGGDLEPPDQGLAVGNNMVAELVNTSLQVFTETGTPISSPISLNSVLAVDKSAGIGDPHIEYDPTVNRWFIDTYYQTSTFNGLLLGVSTSADPLGGYTVYRIDAGSSSVKGCSGQCFPDYPQPGYDANGYYLAADLFSNSTGGFVAAGVYALPKAQLVAGVPLSYQYFLLPDFVVEPAIPAMPGGFDFANGGTEYLMTARNIYDGSTNLRVYAITNTSALGGGAPGGSPTGPLAAHSVTFPAEHYEATVPSVEPDQVGPYGQSLGGTHSPALDGGYNSFGSGVKYLNGTLYGALTSGAQDANKLSRDVIAWFAVKASATPTAVSATIASQGYVVPPAGYSVSYPGIALAANGRGVIGATITNPNAKLHGGYPSTGIVGFATSGPKSIFIVTGQGAASDDGFTGYNPDGTATVGRWGDFSSATVDPVTGEAFVANEYIPSPDIFPRTTYANWGTFITGYK